MSIISSFVSVEPRELKLLLEALNQRIEEQNKRDENTGNNINGEFSNINMIM